MTSHWATRYIGEPWVPHYHDCWGFFRRVQMEQFGRDLPEIDVDACAPLVCRRAFASHDERQRWVQVGHPQEGDAVLMGKNARPAHVGVAVHVDAGAMVLHCVEGAGVVLQTKPSLHNSGWRILGYYRRAAQ
jgi:NlpC/P60 family